MPLAYLITFGTYAARLHGDERGSTRYGRGFVAPDARLHAERLARANGVIVSLDERDRSIVRDAIASVCAFRDWALHAAHVREEHVHCVVTADAEPESIMRDWKSWSSRRLHEDGRFVGQRVWARRGSTRWLWNQRHVDDAKVYVVERQGRDMAVIGRARGQPVDGPPEPDAR
jgi:REP element-mobilizing transposase RayT